MREKFTEWLIAIIFSIIGAVIIIGGINSYISNSKFKKTAIETTATVVSVSEYTNTDSDGDTQTSYTVYVTYTVDDVNYNNSYSSTSYVSKGSTVKVYYDKNNPSKMQESLSGSKGIFMVAIGILFEITGLGVLFNKINKMNENKHLKESGQKILVNFEEVTLNYSYCVNNKNPFIIVCKGNDGKEYKSENLWDNPEPIIRSKNITTFPVYIDTNNPKKYYLSIEDIKEK